MSLFESLGDGYGIVAVYFNHVPVPGAVLGGHILVIDSVDIGGELHAVAVVEHNEVRQSQESGDTSGALRNLFLHTSVGDESIGLVSHNIAEARLQETLSDGAADSHCVTLPEGPGGILNAAGGIHFRMTGAYRAPLTELLKLFHSVFPCERQHGIKHRRHVTRIKEETVTRNPGRVVGVGDEILGVEHIHEVGAAHGATGMTRLGFLYHACRQYADGIGRTVQYSLIHLFKILIWKRHHRLAPASAGSLYQKRQETSLPQGCSAERPNELLKYNTFRMLRGASLLQGGFSFYDTA